MTPPVLLYDGSCGLCAASVQFILRHERPHTLRFAPLQGQFARQVRGRHPELDGVDSVVWVRPNADGVTETVATRSSAAILAADYLGGGWRLALLARMLPAALRDAAYDLVARHHHRLLKNPDLCYVPTPETRARFLE